MGERSVRRVWHFEIGAKAFFKRLYRAYDDHIVGSSAASLSYYFVFSLFPFLFFLATLTAYIPGVREAAETLLGRARGVVPPEAMSVVDAHVRGLVATPRPKLLTLGLLVTIYSASRGVDAVRKALNLAYDVKESRSFLKTELIAVGLTVGGAALVLVGIAILILGGDAGFWLARQLHVAQAYVELVGWIRWPVTALAVMSCAAFGYYFLPDVEQEFRFITPGSVIGTLVWFGAVLGFGAYVSHFGSYNATYGAIGGVIVLMTWFYITGFIFLMGGETNAILEHASPEGRSPGARAAGTAPPPADERPGAVPPGAATSASAAERSQGGLGDGGSGASPH
jgi:membrane protein